MDVLLSCGCVANGGKSAQVGMIKSCPNHPGHWHIIEATDNNNNDD